MGANYRASDVWSAKAEEERKHAKDKSERSDVRSLLGIGAISLGLATFGLSRRKKIGTAIKTTVTNSDFYGVGLISIGTALLVSTFDFDFDFGEDVDPHKTHSTRKGKAIAQYSFELLNYNQKAEI
eukprot:CAMPEP_0204827880 /NCGR_PEP_ID=MMETSP1346-20131115/5402_1 /ASSEMBLY_ACC=CAM_ASM_000771 /TAXON_ID=215587 /ORGANISM="Aplanochytrium stocchinoi, Strain GSBS06" /LENGTH=125 /DNA_ID=CAMNT_0051956529 /DNA_START=48 /DNA_END=422 /DNA_ORIENTATION=+